MVAVVPAAADGFLLDKRISCRAAHVLPPRPGKDRNTVKLFARSAPVPYPSG